VTSATTSSTTGPDPVTSVTTDDTAATTGTEEDPCPDVPPNEDPDLVAPIQLPPFTCATTLSDEFDFGGTSDWWRIAVGGDCGVSTFGPNVTASLDDRGQLCVYATCFALESVVCQNDAPVVLGPDTMGCCQQPGAFINMVPVGCEGALELLVEVSWDPDDESEIEACDPYFVEISTAQSG
jgi:hypothetical protein